MDMSALAAALSSLKSAKDIAETMIGLRDAQAFQAKLLEFQSRLIDANGSALAAQDERTALLDQIRALKEELADLKAWDAEKQKYELKQVPGYNGVLAYALKPEAQGSEPPHWVCATCFQRRKTSILQPETRSPGMEQLLVCHECGSDYYTDGVRRPEHRRD